MSNLSKVNNFIDAVEFENDFGNEPILIGRFTEDKALIGVCSMALGFVSWAITPPLAAIVALIAVNDLMNIDRGGKVRKISSVIDTEAEPVYKDEEYGWNAREQYEDFAQTADVRSDRETPKERPEPVESPEDTSGETASGWRWGGHREDVSDSAPCKRRNRGEENKSDRPRGTSGADRSSVPQLPQVTNRAKRELIEQLKKECPAMLRLVKSHPLRLVGKQRTGKSTMGKLLCLLRMVLLEGHQVVASTPHYEPANPYPEVFRVVGVTPDGKRNYPAIRREWHALAQRVEACRINSITTIWDEFGLQDKVMDEDEIKSVLTSCLRETMKFGEYPIFIVHGETAAFLPGSKGLVTVFLNGTVRVETIGELVEGEDGLEAIRPTGKFNITWLDGSQESGKIPDWLTESYLLELLGNRVAINEADKNPWSEIEEEMESERIEQAEESLKGFTVSSGLKEPLKTLLQKTKEHGDWMTVAEIQRRDWKNVKGYGVDKIHQHLGLLADMGLGEIEEEGKSHSAVRFRAK